MLENNKKIDLFDECAEINTCFIEGDETIGRNKLIELLDKIKNIDKNNIPKNHLQFLNHLIRLSGIYPYIDPNDSIFEDILVSELFKVNTGSSKYTISIEQSAVLKHLLNGEDVLLSAPTSFGKSFIIDAYIALKKDVLKNILIIVPTIALLDETRRRLYKKFSQDYNIITMSGQHIENKNIFILTQERALSYFNTIYRLDLFIVDEFYKINVNDRDNRKSILQKVILHYNNINNNKGKLCQKYFLCPNVDDIEDNNPFISKNSFIKIDFNTTIVNEDRTYETFSKAINAIKNIFGDKKYQKNIIYTNTVKSIENIFNNIKDISTIGESDNKKLLDNFSEWIKNNYSEDWYLYNSIKNGIGTHNGQIPRFLSQIQLKLFEKGNPINTIIATSSLIEGVNTSAENVIYYSNKISDEPMDSFSYKNVKGRAGRMLEYYIGNIYLLEKPPENKGYKLNTNLDIANMFEIPKEIENVLTDQQKEEIKEFENVMSETIGISEFHRLKDNNILKNDRYTILDITNKLNSNNIDNNTNIEKLRNFTDGNKWREENDDTLGVIFNMFPEKTNLSNISQEKLIYAIKCISYNWEKNSYDIIKILKEKEVTIELFCRIESYITFNLYNFISDLNELQKVIYKDLDIDLTSFVRQLQNAFLPSLVYQLEEYGMPRMISKKIHLSELINFEDENKTIKQIIRELIERKEQIRALVVLDEFDKYFLEYFYDGIKSTSKIIQPVKNNIFDDVPF